MTNRCIAAALFGAFVVLGVPFAVSADDVEGPVLKARVQDAIVRAASFRVASQLVRNDVDGAGAATLLIRMTFVNPDRLHEVFGQHATTVEWITIGSTQYRRPTGGSWTIRKRDDPVLYEAAPMLVPDVVFNALPDRRENGALLGAFQVTGAPPDDESMTCTYDKSTYRPRVCFMVLPTRGTATMTYDGWNDPGNVVETPAAP